MVVALALLEGLSLVKTFRRARASFGGGLPATAAGNSRRDAGRTLKCARDLDRFSVAEVTPNLPVTQSEPAAAPVL